MKTQKPKFIFSAGGTGGHIYPALATADALRDMLPDAEILFIGAEKRMEMEKVPHHGYPIIGLPIQGIQRKITLKNFVVPFKITMSLLKASKILKQFRPDVVAGFGGYASGPVLRKAAKMGIPTLLQEQNSFPGLTNRILSKKADSICVAYPGMEQFFSAEKITLTGNPIRSEIFSQSISSEDGRKFFGLDPDKTTILAIGGSLGARTINETVCSMIPEIISRDYQIIWQTGKSYSYKSCNKIDFEKNKNIVVQEFIYEMPQAYAAADVIISRAGAIAVSEIAAVAKPVIFIPSPNVTDDHQTKNAMVFVNRNAALLVKDDAARETLSTTLFSLLDDKKTRSEMCENLKQLAMPDAAKSIAKKIVELREKKLNER
ncbi:MAG: undecaprenyldiphospho-muramoylpentapeptide beta-N-acetylglucosaminyltransferase [Bacteroidetes bacterium GWF2_43_63]|nr:MAG: undecaprenyldiphospho-muramoylpentapeptide beta-N-acetylglucosaminyltransferase [Bacteroidetes bacterium GWE2_42_42]OFY55248.1 MAG: undecaprenyldiphospho-muramoylpentapeptide beta-N-acetylglucosaminyltransferase [Bacteroidetes bacterium GWF2_43_63]HBG70869.1 undecaprenyldiphospho-muramoylpentapeptide beta-N-acetylglucosaminyltransferase [Bacteroidales bacterium]HCB63367.1 undecaprenyldiphospho-muramoylpentapeptide beta-N-acetylglucosaminyltransferase [Bacteroidales bacterium]HCY23070.1 